MPSPTIQGDPPPRVRRVRRALADHAQVTRLARTFRALGDPTRSRLVYALSLEQLCVTELAAALEISLSACSHQLRILRELEIVNVRRQGKTLWYGLNDEALWFCSPRMCQMWKQATEPALATPAEK